MIVATEFYIVVVLLAVMVAVSIRPKTYVANDGVLIPAETSHLLKAVACIVIIMHHFALRRADSDNILLTILKFWGGSFALPIFLLLSAYGIAKSEIRKSLNVAQYIRYRVIKLLVPFWVCVSAITLMYVFTAQPIADETQIATARLGECFPAIGRGEYGLVDILMSCIGLKTVSAGHWFVHVTLVHYLLFMVLKETIGMDRRKMFTLAYLAGLVIYAIIAMQMGWPAHYWRNLWALPAGLVLALYEKELIGRKLMLLVCWITVNVWLLVYSQLLKDIGLYYILFANTSLLAVAAGSWLMRRCELRGGFNIVLWLSGLSYMVYLIHGSLLNEQWLVFGSHNSLLLIIVVSITVAVPLNAMSNKINKAI